MRKVYILDTNVILQDPLSYTKFRGNDVVIPLSVIEEIDNFKSNQDSLGQNARIFGRRMTDHMNEGNLAKGIYLDDYDVKVKIEPNHSEKFHINLDEYKADNRILSTVKYYCDNVDNKVILVSKDINLRIKAHALGLHVEDYMNDSVEISELYTGYKTIYNSLDKLYDGGISINDIDDDEIYPNKFYHIKEGNSSGLGIYKKNQGQVIPIRDKVAWGIKALNKEQSFALYALLDDDIKLVTLVGKSGCGKTLLSLAAGLQKALNENKYNKFVVFRPIVPMGNDIGYLPGTEEEKLSTWMRPIKDNIEFLMNDNKDEVTQDYLSKLIDIQALTYIRGRSIPNQYMLIDEAQNTSSHESKTILTRVGESTKIILTGDPYQIDHPYLDSNNNGLTHVVENMKDSELSATILLTKGERSQLAEEATKKL